MSVTDSPPVTDWAPWTNAITRRIHGRVALLVLGTIMAAAPVAVPIMLDVAMRSAAATASAAAASARLPGKAPPWLVVGTLVVAALLMIAPLLMWRELRRLWRARRLVPAHDGRICIGFGCLTPLCNVGEELERHQSMRGAPPVVAGRRADTTVRQSGDGTIDGAPGTHADSSSLPCVGSLARSGIPRRDSAGLGAQTERDAPPWHREVDRGANNDELRCPSCGLRTTSAMARRYWEQLAVSPLWAERFRWRKIVSHERGWRWRWLRAARWIRRHPILYWVGSFATLACLTVGGALAFGVDPVALLTGMVPPLAIFGTFGLVARVFMRRQSRAILRDRTRRCTACGYEQPPDGRTSRCPECGASWAAVGGTAIGWRAPRSAWATAIVLMSIAGVSMAVLIGPLQRSIGAIMPTRLLVSRIGAGSMSASGAAATLARRRLTPEQTNAALAACLDLRRTNDYAPGEVQAFLESHLLAGTMPPELKRRLAAESLPLTIVVPAHIRAGEPTVAALTATHPRITGFATTTAMAALGGWRIGDDPLAERAGVAWTAWLCAGLAGVRPAAADRSPRITFTPGRSGPLRIVAEAWIFLLPGTAPGAGSNVPIAWNEDGTPQPPAGALVSERVVIERTIDVEPSLK
ncbi:MAG: hypothetical protein U0575_08425 [Phycisphaerales bacterium]